MAQVQYCTCRVNLSGQNCHVFVHDQYNQVSWPEVRVIMQLHGDENVTDVIPTSIGEVVPQQEKERLIQTYGFRVVETCFPGRDFRMSLMMTDDTQLPHRADPDEAPSLSDEAMQALTAAPAMFKPGRQPRQRDYAGLARAVATSELEQG